MVDYKSVMCCNCKECTVEKIIEYKYGNCEIIRCENYNPKYKYKKDTRGDCALFIDLYDKIDYNEIGK